MTDHTMLSTNLATSTLISPGLSTARSVPTRSLGAPLWDIAGRVPSLDLNLAQNKNLLDSVTGQSLVTFTRASTGTYVGADGLIKTAAVNEARFDHNPSTGESLGLLVEEQRTNLLLQSENLGATWAFSSASASTNSVAAPDGQTTADTLIPSNGVTSGLCRQDTTALADSTTYTLSVFLKSAGLASVTLQFYNKANTFHGSKSLNLSNGTLSGSEFVGTSSVVAYPNGWYRLILAGLGSGTGATTPNIRIVCLSTGDGTSGIYLWGAQLEAGAFPSSYIPTTTSAATRSADVCSISGSNFSSWYLQDEGTVFAEFQQYAAGGTAVNISDNTGSNFINIFTSAAANARGSANVFTSGTNNGRIDSGGTFVANSNVRVTYGLSAGSRSLSVLGNAVSTSATPVTLPTVNRLYVGVNQDATSGWNNGTIRRLTYWPTRLSNNVLQAITA